MASTTFMQGEQHRKGPWVEEEDKQLTAIVTLLGNRKWDTIARASGLNRSGKSCRLRWMNYLRPNLKHGNISSEEEQIILRLHRLWGNKWSKIARWLPGRTDNEIKNYWRTHLKKKSEMLGQENWESNEVILIHDNDRSSGVCGEELATKEELKATDNYVDTNSSSEHAYVSSPYENNLYDWMLEVSTDYTEVNQEAYGYTAEWSAAYEDRDISIWDYSGSLWDMI